jgi:hypothetical protein
MGVHMRGWVVLGLSAFLGLGCGSLGRDSAVSASDAGGAAAASAADKALHWLVTHQQADGSWSSAEFPEGFREAGVTPARVHDVGVTGLAVLALQEAGHQPGQGEYANAVKSALSYLRKIQDPKLGCFGEANSHQAFLYDHALATRAVVRAYAATQDAALRASAVAGLQFIEAARNPYKAWRYAYPPDGQNDVSMTGFMVLALADAQAAGLPVSAEAKSGALLFIDEMTDEATGRTGYLARGGYSAREPSTVGRWPETLTEAMTAVALSCRYALWPSEPDPALMAKSHSRLLLMPPQDVAERIDYFYWYFGTRAMEASGSAEAATWDAALRTALVPRQAADGSFDPLADPWGHRGGTVYATAINALTLQYAAR